MTRPVSRVLSRTIIYLGRKLPNQLSATFSRNIGPMRKNLSAVLLRIGFAEPCSCQHAGELLPRRSILTQKIFRRYISVALSLGSPPAAVSRYPALWSSDFPRANSFELMSAIVQSAHADNFNTWKPKCQVN